MADIISKSFLVENEHICEIVWYLKLPKVKRLGWDLDIFLIMTDLSTCFVSCTFVLDCNSNFKLKA